MFTRKEYPFFALSFLLIVIGFCLMAFDTVENGFGIATLWIAPPLLLIGLLLPIPGIVGYTTFIDFFSRSSFQANRSKYLFGWTAMAISLAVYLITIEPTASLWDCAEFIASAYKLEVPHTPGNPLLLLIGRIFSMFAFGDVKRVAICVNAMSSVFSAVTVYGLSPHLFFW